MQNQHKKTFINYTFREATINDNSALIQLLKDNPIHMEMEYAADRLDNFFFRVDRLLGSKVIVAINPEGNIAGCITLLKLSGEVAGEKLSFQYVTDLVRSSKEQDPLLMKKLLNFAFANYFDTDLIVGLVNEKNARARSFSVSDFLKYPGSVSARLSYFEIVPIQKHTLKEKFTLCSPQNQMQLNDALGFVDRFYKNYAFFQPISEKYYSEKIENLPGYSLNDWTLVYEGTALKGVMLQYDPSKITKLLLVKMDLKNRLLLKLVRFVNQFTGLLFNPPMEGSHIKTLQIRYLSGSDEVQKELLHFANNYVKDNKFHSISLLVDERLSVPRDFSLQYKYTSLLYTACKPAFQDKMNCIAEHPVFFDITFA